jgi:hypothetical protein
MEGSKNFVLNFYTESTKIIVYRTSTNISVSGDYPFKYDIETNLNLLLGAVFKQM